MPVKSILNRDGTYGPVTIDDFQYVGKIPGFEHDDPYYRYKNTELLLDGKHGIEFIRDGYLDKLKPMNGDTYVSTFPKAGTTWTQEMVYLIQSNYDFKTANLERLTTRFPFMEMTSVPHIPTGNEVLSMKPPRLFKTHLPCYVLPEDVLRESKIVYTTRNVKDVIVSYYFFARNHPRINYTGDLATYLDHFLNDRVLYASYWRHVLGAWERRHEPNLLFLFFEDMKKDLAREVLKTVDFLDKTITDDQLNKVMEHCSFDSMKENPKTNNDVIFNNGDQLFMRKGDVGDWRNHFTEEMNDKVNRYIEKYLSDATGLKFDYEL